MELKSEESLKVASPTRSKKDSNKFKETNNNRIPTDVKVVLVMTALANMAYF